MNQSHCSLKCIFQSFYARAIALLPLRSLANPKNYSRWERKGIHITANDYYSPLPRFADLKEADWNREFAMQGIELRIDEQMALLELFGRKFSAEYAGFARTAAETTEEDYYLDNPFFSSVDAEIAYGMVRHFKPRKIIEVGSGFSTRLSAKALVQNEREGTARAELTAIECYPGPLLKKGFPGLTRLLEQRIEEVDLAFFASLGENDILFIDSSHTVRFAGDVQFLFLEVLPILKPGVIIHVHDIFFPFDYPKKWIIDDNLFWAEQYLLQSFLTCNDSFQVLWCGYMFHRKYPEKLAGVCASYDPKSDLGAHPKSFWMKRSK